MRRAAFLAFIFSSAVWLSASDVADLHPPWDAIKLVSFNQGSAADRSWQLQTPTTGAGVTFPAGYRTADFGGTSTAVVSYPDNDATESAPLTVCAWIRIDVYTSYRNIMSDITQSTTYEGWHFYYGPGISRGLAFGQTDSSVIPVVSSFKQAWTASGTLTAGTWYHVAATLDSLGATPILYINGAAQSTTVYTIGTVSSLANSEPVRIGGSIGPDNASFHDGGIDDVRIYSTVKTANEIAAIYAEGIGASRP